MSDKSFTHYLLSRIQASFRLRLGFPSDRVYQKTKLQNQQKKSVVGFLQVACLWFRFLDFFPVSVTHFHSFQFQFCFPQPYFTFFLFIFVSTHLGVMVGHGKQSNGAVGVAAVADGGHVSVPHDWHGGQRLARGVRVRDAVALPA